MTGARFVERPVVGGTQFRCLGVGSRRAFVFKLYSVAFCLEGGAADQALQQAFESHRQTRGEELADALRQDEGFFRSLASAPGDKMIVLRLARDVSRGRLEGALRDTLRRLLSPADVERVLQAACFPGGMREGEVALLRSRGRDFVVHLGTERRVLEDAGAINERLWGVWLGPQSAAANLKESIAARAAMQALAVD